MLNYAINEMEEYLSSTDELKIIYEKLEEILKKEIFFDYKGLASITIVAKFDENKILTQNYREKILYKFAKLIENLLINMQKRVLKALSLNVLPDFLYPLAEKKIKNFSKQFQEQTAHHLAEVLARYVIDMFFMTLLYLHIESPENLIKKLQNLYPEAKSFSKKFNQVLTLDNVWDFIPHIFDFLIEEEYITTLLKQDFFKFFLDLKIAFMSAIEEKLKSLKNLKSEIQNLETFLKKFEDILILKTPESKDFKKLGRSKEKTNKKSVVKRRIA